MHGSTGPGPGAAAPVRAEPRTRRLADFTADPRTLLLAAMSVCVATLGVGAAFVLVKLIALVTNLVWFGRLDGMLPSLADAARTPFMVVAPAAGGLLVGLMARYGTAKIRGHGIPEAIETILIGNSRIGPKVALLKPLSSAIAIGTGGPFGAEGPIIMTGGALGSLFAQFFDLSAAERKTLLVCGAVAGMTAIFGTPIAATLLAVELLLFEWKPRSFIPVAVAAVVAIAWRPLAFGAAPLFPVPAHPALPWWGLAPAAGVGVLIGLQSAALTLALYAVEDAFHRLPVHWMWWPMLGGVAVGLGGLIDPQALGVGYDVIAAELDGRITVASIVALVLVKSTIWLISLSSGTSGGVLAPLVMLGGALAWLVGHALPGTPGFWALLGMAAMLGGTMRAPLTGVLFAVELTGDFAALPLVLCATVAAYAVTVLLLKRSILTEKIARRGQHITAEYAIDPFALTRAGEIMTREVATLASGMAIAEAVALFTSSHNEHLGYPVVEPDGRVVGIVTRSDALRWEMDGADDGETLGERLSDASLVVAHPDDVVGHVVDLMISEDAGLVPIVDPSDARLVGIVTMRDLLAVPRAVGALERDRARFYVRRRSRAGERPA